MKLSWDHPFMAIIYVALFLGFIQTLHLNYHRNNCSHADIRSRN